MGTNFDIFAIKHNDVIPTRGGVLIAEPFMKDVYFQRAVVLLVEHNQEGSMGFVLNKKTDLFVNDFFLNWKVYLIFLFIWGGTC